jgi:hypothetical protein
MNSPDLDRPVYGHLVRLGKLIVLVTESKRRCTNLLQTLRFGILGFDPKNKTAKIFDSGNEPYSASNLPFVGKSGGGGSEGHDQERSQRAVILSAL